MKILSVINIVIRIKMVQVCSYNAQGTIECVTKEVIYETEAEFEKKGMQQFWKEQKAEGPPIGVTNSQVNGKSGMNWIGSQSELIPVKDPVRDIIAPPYTTENIDWKRYEKPLYPFAASEWNEKTGEPYSWIPKVEAFTNKISTWTSRLETGNIYTSLEGQEDIFEKNTLK